MGNSYSVGRKIPLLASILALLIAAPASAQFGDSIPSTAYFNTFGLYYDGDYTAALGLYQNELRTGIQSAQTRWIDSICYATMCGECYYQMGQYSNALNQYTAALKYYSAFNDWMLRAQFPPVIAPANVGARTAVPWGVTKRASGIGSFQPAYPITQGQLNNNNVIQQGGVLQAPIIVQIRASEIIRCTALAMRRRRELMGPVCKYDPLTNELVSLLERRPAPSNHWSQAWIDVLLGAAYASAGNTSRAVTTLERSLVVHGELDHPLTAAALLELGQLALQTGNIAAAGRYFEEATYAATTFPDAGILEEAFRYGQLVHLLTNQKGVYPPLAPAIIWAQRQNYQQLHASLWTLTAENLAALGQTPAAVTAIADARGVIGRRAMGNFALGARLNFVTALTNYQANQVAQGDQALAAAMQYQKTGSLWLFHMGLVDNLYLSGEIYDRVATLLYEYVLRDPTPADWGTSPLEALSVLVNPHPLLYEHWFEATLKRNKEPEVALEIADRARRHRYFSSLPFGGRLAALRWVLEGPQELLNEQALLERQDLLAKYTRYQELANEAKAIKTELAKHPAVDSAIEARQEQAKQLGNLAEISQSQEVILREISVRREPVELVFPPLRRTKDVQQALPQGHALLAFFATSSENLYGFMFTKDKYAMWRVAAPTQLRRHLSSMLYEMGNADHNHAVSAKDLSRENWKKTAGKVVELLFDKSGVDLSAKFDELIIVPDGLLWYLPFEALPVGKKGESKPLLSQVRIRYSPTVGLAIPYNKKHKPEPGTTGVVLGKLFPRDDESVAQEAFEPLSRAVEGAVSLPRALPAPSSLFRVLLDQLIVLDDIEPAGEPYGWSPAQVDGGKSMSTLAAWMSLPWGGPERVILPGFHTAAENGIRKGLQGGNDLFLASCGLMSTGVRTILISRWRMGGQTSFDLIREFAQELPNRAASDAWQRSVQLVSERPLDSQNEPRLAKVAANTDAPTADHPLFWAGYMLVDSGRLDENQEPPPPPQINIDKKQPVPAAGDVKDAGKKPDPDGGIGKNAAEFSLPVDDESGKPRGKKKLSANTKAKPAPRSPRKGSKEKSPVE